MRGSLRGQSLSKTRFMFKSLRLFYSDVKMKHFLLPQAVSFSDVTRFRFMVDKQTTRSVWETETKERTAVYHVPVFSPVSVVSAPRTNGWLGHVKVQRSWEQDDAGGRAATQRPKAFLIFLYIWACCISFFKYELLLHYFYVSVILFIEFLYHHF